MKTTLFIAVVILMSWGCNSRVDELEKQNSDLRTSNQQLTQDLSERDAYVDDITGSINEIYNSLESVKATEQSLLSETNKLESEKKLTREEVRSKLLDKVTIIKTAMHDNQEKVADLQHKVNSFKAEYTGLRKMVATLKSTVDARDKSITELNDRIRSLEDDIAMKSRAISEKDSLINDQTNTINLQKREITTAYYVAGTRRELEQKGILKSEGGFLWGLLGSTSVLASGFDEKYFRPIDRKRDMTIEVKGKIDEIIPKRKEEYFHKSEMENDQSMLTIADPNYFWQDKYLVIVTDKEN